jgi:hypothetical protein
MSRGGVRFLCNEELKPGHKLVLEITVKHGAPIKVAAEVIWVDGDVPPKGRYKFRAGARFTEYLADSWKRLRDWEDKMLAEAKEGR